MLTLDRETLKAMRSAQDVWFHGRPTNNYGPGDAEMSIRTRSVNYAKGETYDSVPTIRVGLPVYGIPKDRNLFASIGGAVYDRTWGSVCRVLRVGDKIALEVSVGGGTNGYCRAATGNGHEMVADNSGYRCKDFSASLIYEGLHVDKLFIRVERERKHGVPTQFTFYIDESVSPDNSARMVRLDNS